MGHRVPGGPLSDVPVRREWSDVTTEGTETYFVLLLFSRLTHLLRITLYDRVKELEKEGLGIVLTLMYK